MACAWIGVAILLSWFSPAAHAADGVWACPTANVVGLECTGGWDDVTAATVLSGGWNVGSCPAGQAEVGDDWDTCEEFGWRLPSALSGSDLCEDWDATYYLCSDYGIGTGGGDPPGGDGEGAVIDFFESGTYFAGAFVLCAVFWALGRGIGAIVELFRRY